MSAGLVRGDAVALPLADASVDLVVTSPPYFALRSYQDGGEHYDGQIGSEPTPQEFLQAMWAVTAECRRVLKPSGSMWVNLGDKYAGGGGHWSGDTDNAKGRQAFATTNGGATWGHRAKSLMGLPWRYAIGCIDDLDLILRAEVIWSKPNGLPESVTDRVRRSHEQWFHFTKEPRYYSAVDEIREPHAAGTAERYAAGYGDWSATNDERTVGYDLGGDWSLNPLGKLPGSVWSIPSEPLRVPEHLGVDHFAAFPQEWPRRIILGWSPSGICVDCGEGRRPVVAKEKIGGRIRTTADTPALGAGRAPSGHMAPGALSGFTTEATITGYVCACPEPTAPTRPAVVLDPFAGTGTTVMVARALGRFGVGIDLSADYLRLAHWRIFESGHASKSVERSNRERQGVLI